MKAKSSKAGKARTRRTGLPGSSRGSGSSLPAKPGMKVNMQSRERRIQTILDKLVKTFEPALRDLAK
jgi:hypothetical protein